jgi:hypothetical protein
VNDFLGRPIEVGDFLLSGKVPFGTSAFVIWKVGKEVQYENKTFYIIEERTNPEKLVLIKDGSEYYKIPEADLMLEKLQQG